MQKRKTKIDIAHSTFLPKDSPKPTKLRKGMHLARNEFKERASISNTYIHNFEAVNTLV